MTGQPKPCVRPMWSLTTGHLRETTCNEWLGSDTRPHLPVAYAKGDYGWFVAVPDPILPAVPNELKLIFQMAREFGFEWIEFDCDAPIFDPLPLFEW